MKKLLIYVGIIVLLFALLYFVNAYSRNSALEQYEDAAQELYETEPKNLRDSTLEQLDDPNYQNIILPDELDTRLENGEDLIVYFFSPECVHCRASTPVLTELTQETGAEVVQYNVLEFGQGFTDYSFTQTPTTIVFEDGQEKDRFVGGFPDGEHREHMKAFLEKYAAAQGADEAENEEQAS